MKSQLFLFLALFACNESPTHVQNETKRYVANEILEANLTPTVDIQKYTLIADPSNDRKNDATEILQVKRKWPLVMQSPSEMAFDSILAKNFTFTDNGHLFNRAEYIKDRTAPSDWKITNVHYDNLTLQFFDNLSLLTYRNQVTNENIKTQEIEIEHISWADMYSKENGKWKICSAHVVDFRLEPQKKSIKTVTNQTPVQ